MTWQRRTREAAYTGPAGVRMTFNYEDLERTFEKKTSQYNFPDGDGTYVQDLGVTSETFPLVCIFSGEESDIEADVFEFYLKHQGIGVLEHPVYGTRQVVPSGRVKRTDARKTAANVSTVTVTFVETIGVVYPTGQESPADEIQAGIAIFIDSSSEELEEDSELETELQRQTLGNRINAAIDQFNEFLKPLADTLEEVQREYNDISDSITRGLDVLIGQPLTLGFQTAQLIQSPARSAAEFQARFEAYAGLTSEITGSESEDSNQFALNTHLASNYIGGIATSALNGNFETRPQAIEAATGIIAEFEALQVWREAELNRLELVDTGASYQALQEVVSLTAGYLVQLSFSLLQERIIELDRNRNIVELEAELYGTLDINLDLLINSNNLTGSEIITLPAGKEIKYYA